MYISSQDYPFDASLLVRAWMGQQLFVGSFLSIIRPNLPRENVGSQGRKAEHKEHPIGEHHSIFRLSSECYTFLISVIRLAGWFTVKP